MYALQEQYCAQALYVASQACMQKNTQKGEYTHAYMREDMLPGPSASLPLYLAAIFTFYCLLHLLDFLRQVGSFQQWFCVARERETAKVSE
jgi:hypothetical protein